jgi:hypothetical protein
VIVAALITISAAAAADGGVMRTGRILFCECTTLTTLGYSMYNITNLKINLFTPRRLYLETACT